jgi:hypothetical protein
MYFLMLAIIGTGISLKLILVGQSLWTNLLSHVFGTKTALNDIHHFMMCDTKWLYISFILIFGYSTFNRLSTPTQYKIRLKTRNYFQKSNKIRNGSERVLTILHGEMQLGESHFATFEVILLLTFSCCLASGPI